MLRWMRSAVGRSLAMPPCNSWHGCHAPQVTQVHTHVLLATQEAHPHGLLFRLEETNDISGSVRLQRLSSAACRGACTGSPLCLLFWSRILRRALQGVYGVSDTLAGAMFTADHALNVASVCALPCPALPYPALAAPHLRFIMSLTGTCFAGGSRWHQLPHSRLQPLQRHVLPSGAHRQLPTRLPHHSWHTARLASWAAPPVCSGVAQSPTTLMSSSRRSAPTAVALRMRQ
jgi:hypothetical protein